MTSRAELVDVGVQTQSPVGSWWSLRRSHFSVGSPSILGSPPGSQLNLRSPIGSHFNLVSPSSSMFLIYSDDDDSKVERELLSCETSSIADCAVERRSCLKVRDKSRELGRRSSMKQVQWDEDGMTWDVHGASIDPEELNMAIQKHLELKSEEEQKPLRKSPKKKRAPNPPVQQRATDKEMGSEERTEGEGLGRSPAEEQVEQVEVGGDQSRRRSLSPGPVQRRKRRSFKRPGWCGGSTKHHD